MKRNLLICILVVVFSLSFVVQAKNETLLEENWKEFLDTTELDYSAEEGKIKLDVEYSEAANDLFYQLSGGYGYNDYIQTQGYLSGLSIFEDGADTDFSLGTSVKAKLYDQNRFAVAALAGINYNDAMSFDLNMYTDFNMDENLTIHNNLDLDIDDATIEKRLYNGVDYQYNQQHAFRAYLCTDFTDFDSITNRIKLMYKNDFNDQINFLSSIEKSFQEDNLLFSNLLEVEPIEDLLVTGHYDLNSQDDDQIGIDVRKDFTDFTVGAGYQYNTNKTSTLYGNLTYDFFKDMEGELELKSEDSSMSVIAGVEYSL